MVMQFFNQLVSISLYLVYSLPIAAVMFFPPVSVYQAHIKSKSDGNISIGSRIVLTLMYLIGLLLSAGTRYLSKYAQRFGTVYVWTSVSIIVIIAIAVLRWSHLKIDQIKSNQKDVADE